MPRTGRTPRTSTGSWSRSSIPAYYDRDQTGLPTRWAQLMRNSIASTIWRFSTTRMLHEYVEGLYLPAAGNDNPAPSDAAG